VGPILLLPGLDGTGRLFAPLIEAASPALELRVIGYPADEALDYDSLLQLVLTQAPDGPYAIVAESFSGPIALMLAARAPRPPTAVVLVASFATAPVSRGLAIMARALAPVIFAVPPPAFAMRAFLVGGDAPASLVAELREAIRSVAPPVLAARVRATLDVDARQSLVDCPARVLYLAAARDRLLARGIGERLQAARPDVELASLPAPHLVLQTSPIAALEIITDFVASASAVSSASAT